MHEHDLWLEDRLRTVLREEAASLPFTLTVADLERRLTERSRRPLVPAPFAWAAAVVILVAGLAVATGLPESLIGPVGPSPTPSASPSGSPELPDSDALKAGIPDATIILEARRLAGSSPSSTPAPDDRYVLGQVSPAHTFVVAAACVGAESVTIEVGDLSDLGTYLSTPVRCGGTVEVSPGTDPSSDGVLDVTVIATAGASWTVAVGEYPAAVAEPRELPAVTITAGWSLLLGTPDEAATMVEPSEGAGLEITVPPAATRVAVWATCTGDAPATATLGDATVEVDCPAGATERLEVSADPSGTMSARITSDGRIWARLVAEVDSSIEIVYPAAPTLPEAVAAAGWAATGTKNLTIGTIGSNTPRLIALPSHKAGGARGDLVTVAVADGRGGGRIELYSTRTASRIGTILVSDRFVQDTWLDATHALVVYVVGTGATIQFRSIRLDGSDDRLVLDIPVADGSDPLYSLAPGLAHDDSAFVIETCRAAGCTRTITDLASGEARTIDTTDAPVCAMIGVIDGYVVGRNRAGCEPDDSAPVSVVVSPLEGGPTRTIDAVGDADGMVVRTADGPRAVLVVQADGGARQTIVAVDLASGDVATIHEPPAEDLSSIAPMPVRLPDGYVLLATSLSDDPPSRGFIVRTIPRLVNLDTGETVELPNLPHSLGGDR